MSGDVQGLDAQSQPMPADKLRVFISYSRQDIAFADQLDATLDLGGFECTLDRHGIHGAEAWQEKLGSLIREADTVVFVLTPASAASEICAWEVDQATALGKRIIPVVPRSLSDISAPPPLAALNYIFFYEEPKKPGSGFRAGLVDLVKALKTDLGWMRDHTRYLTRAIEWDSGGRQPNRLLSGGDIAEAKAWAARKPKDAPPPTELHLALIKASEIWDVEQKNERTRQLEARERLVQQAEQDRTAREAAQREALVQARRVTRRTMAGLVAALVLAIVAGGLGFLAWKKQKEAEISATAARQTSREALLSQSKFLVGPSTEATNSGDAGTGLLLALEAVRDAHSEKADLQSRDRWGPADASLYHALMSLKELSVGSGHGGAVDGVAVTPDGTRFITGSADGTARVWELATGKELIVLRGHREGIRSIAVTPDGTRVVTGSSDGTARVWDLMTGKELVVLKCPASIFSVAVTPDGTRLITASGMWVKVWELATGKELIVLSEQHQGFVYTVVVTPDGTRVVTGSGDRIARVWDLATGKKLAVFRGHKDQIYSVAVTPDSLLAVTSSGENDKTVRVWELATGKEVASLKGYDSVVRSVAVTPDGASIVTGSEDKTVRIWDLATAKALAVLRGHDDQVRSVAVTRDGTRVVTGSDDRTARVWKLDNREEPNVLRGHDGDVQSVAVTPDGTRVITGSEDKTARVWDLVTGKELAVLRGHTFGVNSVEATPDGTRLVTGSYDKTTRVWDLATSNEVATIKGTPAAMTPDGTRVITAFDDKTARVWDLATGNELAVLKGHDGNVCGLAVTPDGTRVITGSEDKTARVWELATGKELAVLRGHYGHVCSVAAAPDGTRVITGSEDKTARIWELATAKLLAVLESHDGWIMSVAVTPDGGRLVTSDDYAAQVWDLATGKQLKVLRGHSGPIYRAALTPDGTRLITGSQDGTARVWDLATGSELAVLDGHEYSVGSIALTPDGTRLVTGSDDRTARVWDLFPSGQALVDLAQRRAPRCLTPAQRRAYHVAPEPPRWCGAEQKWPYDAAGAVIESLEIVRAGDPERQFEPDILRNAVLHANPKATNTIDTALAAAYFDRGKKLLSDGKDTEAEAAMAKARERGANSKALEAAWAEVYFERGKNLLWDDKDTEAETALAKAREHGTDPKAIEAASAEAYFERGKKLLYAGNDAAAESALAKACERGTDPKAIEAASAEGYVYRGKDLLSQGKDAEAEAMLAKARERGADPKSIDAASAEAYFDRGKTLLGEGKDADADVALAKAREHGAELAPIAEVYLERGKQLLGEGNIAEADAALAKARNQDAEPASIVATYLEGGKQLLTEGKDNEAEAAFARAKKQGADPKEIFATYVAAGDRLLEQASDSRKRQAALVSFERAITLAKLDNLENKILAEALFSRGRAHSAEKNYSLAIADFQEAERLGYEAPNLPWEWINDIGDELIDQGKPVEGLLTQWTNVLEIRPETREKIELRDLKLTDHFWGSIEAVHGANLKSRESATECDLLASQPNDPLRHAEGVDFENLDPSTALPACEREVAAHKDEPRFIYLRGRVYSRAARVAAANWDEAAAEANDARALADFEAARTAGYPIACHNLASAYKQGEGVEANQDKAADLKLELLNRILHCCWAEVARQLLAEEEKYERVKVRRIVTELTRWSAALGSEPAKALLAELSSKGVLPPGTAAYPPATFNALPPWLEKNE